MNDIRTLAIAFGLSLLAAVYHQETASPERDFIESHNQLMVKHFGAKLVDLDIQKLNHHTSLLATKQVWRSTAKLDFDGTQKEVATMFVDLVANDGRVLPMFTIEDGKKTEILDEKTMDLLAKRAAHFLTYEAKLFNEPDGVNDNGLNIRSFTLKNGAEFRGHLMSRNGNTVVIEKLPEHTALQIDDFSDADQKWLESAPAKLGG